MPNHIPLSHMANALNNKAEIISKGMLKTKLFW